MLKCLVYLLICGLAFSAPKRHKKRLATPITPSSLTAEIEEAWAKTLSYQTSFKQTVGSKRLKTTDETTGVLYVAKPGRLRWEGSDGVTQILNGNKVILIKTSKRRKTRTIDIYENGSRDLDLRALSFLSMDGKFSNNYDLLVLDSSGPLIQMKLTPQSKVSDPYIAELDKSGYLLLALNIESSDSNVRIEFMDRKVNQPLAESLFDYVPEPDDLVHKH